MTKPQSLPFFGKVIFFDGREYDCPDRLNPICMCRRQHAMNTTETEFSPEHVDSHPDNTPEASDLPVSVGSRS